MLYVLKDLVKSRTMILAMVFIIGISYVGGINNNQNLKQNISNNISVEVN